MGGFVDEIKKPRILFSRFTRCDFLTSIFVRLPSPCCNKFGQLYARHIIS